MLIDTHAHSDPFNAIPISLDHPVIFVSVDLNSAKNLINQLSVDNPHQIMAVGVHPWFVKAPLLLDLLFEFIEHHQLKIMGEIGLDFSTQYRDYQSDQLSVFSQQLRFAHQQGLSVSLHLVKAFDSMHQLLTQYPVKGAIHGFPASVEQAQRFTKLGLKIGINGLILRDNAPRYHKLVRDLPLTDIVLETDSPNICYPNGQVGDLAMIYLVAQKVAEIKSCPLEEVIEITGHNAIESFQLEQFR